jgi:glycosyltransferase involved in cell wall biosynthesis
VRTFDIGVAPLHGPYDQRRSWIKGLEYLLAGVPWVGTQGEPYRDLAGLGILIPNSPESWAYAVGQLIKDLEYEQAASMKKTDVAAQWFMDRQLETYGRVYEEVRNNFAASRGRLPGIQRIGS